MTEYGSSDDESSPKPVLRERMSIIGEVCEFEENDLKGDAVKSKYKEKIHYVIKSLESAGTPADFVNQILDTEKVPTAKGTLVLFQRFHKRFLLQIAVPLNWDQLGYQPPGSSNPTSLHRAFKKDAHDPKEKPSFMTIFCDLMEQGIREKSVSQEQVASIIAKTNNKEQNGLHLAMPVVDIAERLVRMADEATFKRAQSNGNTPLHDALRFPLDEKQAKPSKHPYLVPICATKDKSTRRPQASSCPSPPTSCIRCQDAEEKYRRRAGLICEILRKYPLALASHNKSGMSPLSYHLLGRKEFRKKYSKFNEPAQTDSKDPDTLDWVGMPAQTTPANTGRPRGSVSQSHDHEASSACPGKVKNYYWLSHSIEQLLWEEAFYIEGGYEKACQCLVSSGNGTSNDDDISPSPSSANRVFIPTGRITGRTTMVYTHWKFEPMMTYVHLKVTPNPERDRVPTDSVQWVNLRAESSSALEEVFKWLTEIKGVKRILKLVVEDNADWPCSEMTIQNCLGKLEDVRYLNWKRPNISAETLFQKAPNIVELWLYSTGINAVLSGWADRSGLQRLTKLRVVRLDAKMGYETENANQMNVDNFKKNLLKWYADKERVPHVEAIYERTSSRGIDHGTGGGISNDSPSNAWLKSIGDLAIKLGNDMPQVDNEDNPNRTRSKDEHAKEKNRENDFIKIALLDDGVDPEGGLGKFMPGIGWPMASEPVGDEAPSAPFYSTGQEQHGNRMAKLITTACPFVRLYVAKMSGQTSSEGGMPHPTFRVDDAVEAIKWSIKQKVDIISMSWNLWLSEGDAGELKRAIQEAHEKKILMFCAASEKKPTGSGNDKAWPTSCTETFSVGAASNTRAAKGYVGEDAKHLFPTDGVIKDVADGRNSAATALAAGLAALILFSLKKVKQEERENTEQKKKQVGEGDKTGPTAPVKGQLFGEIDIHSTMLNVFKSLARQGGTYVDIDALVKQPVSFGTIAEYCKPHVVENKSNTVK